MTYIEGAVRLAKTAYFFIVGHTLTLWRRIRGLSFWYQVGVFVLAGAVVVALIAVIRASGATPASDTLRTVSTQSVARLGSGETGTDLFGTVRSVTEANLIAESSGSVRSVHAKVGDTVPAGYVLASLENASEAAALLSAEGAYDGAIAAQDATSLSSAEVTARTAYRSAYASIDSLLQTEVDTLFGSYTAVGPNLLINPGPFPGDKLSRDRASIDATMDAWRERLATADSRDPEALLTEARGIADQVDTFVENLSEAANASNSRATATQIANITAARAEISATSASLTGAADTYRQRKVGATGASAATVKQALGALRAAQANFEKTIIRTPIAGTVNYLPLRVGDYVNAFTSVASVSRAGGLEITAPASIEQAALIKPGDSVTSDGLPLGSVTSVSPGIDPTTKQVEVRISVRDGVSLVPGSSVRVTLANATPATPLVGTLSLPLASVKLTSDTRLVFSVDETNHLVEHVVTTGNVHGSRIDITSELPSDLYIVTDARGLSTGQEVKVAAQR